MEATTDRNTGAALLLERCGRSNAETLIAAGFVRDPNVTDEWYAAGPGVKEPARGFHLFATETAVSLAVMPYGKFNRTDAVDVYRFVDADDVLGFLRLYGVPSLPGASHIPGRLRRSR